MKSGPVLFLALMATLALSQIAQAGERLFYQIEVTNPGTKSQGWTGTLYDQNGSAMEVPAGQTVSTGAGSFESVNCQLLFIPCGMIHTRMVAWMKTHNGNVLMDSNWTYRLYVIAEGSRSEGWRGELLNDGQSVQPPPETASTPMGPFQWSDSAQMWGDHGWFPVSWSK